MSKIKYKIGDEVRIIGNNDFHLESKQGMIGVIFGIIRRSKDWIQYEVGFGKERDSDGLYENWDRVDQKSLEIK